MLEPHGRSWQKKNQKKERVRSKSEFLSSARSTVKKARETSPVEQSENCKGLIDAIVVSRIKLRSGRGGRKAEQQTGLRLWLTD